MSDEQGQETKWGVAEVSINSMMGLTSPHTLKLCGTIENQDVVVLMDSGATHNFIAEELVRKLNMPLTSITSYTVMMGAGISIKGVGICKEVALALQGLTIVEDFLPLPLGNAYVVLGFQRLASLGTISINWKLLSMKITMGDSVCNLQGDPSLSRSLISLKIMIKSVKGGETAFLIELNALDCIVASAASTATPKFPWISRL